MKIPFVKYQGTGNDFVIIDNRKLLFPKSQTLIEKICTRRFGVGADGLMLVENSDDFDFKMVYYNSDGRESSMCGNGGRCISAFAHHQNIAQSEGTFIAIDGPHEYAIDAQGHVSLKMMDVKDFLVHGNDFEMNTGSPHYVRFMDDVMSCDMVSLGRSIRYNETYSEKGINVNIVDNQSDKVTLRTYERGVEDETFSCGTGTVAAALSLAIKNKMNQGPVQLHTKGGLLEVDFKYMNESFTDVWLKGPALAVFEGVLDLSELIY